MRPLLPRLTPLLRLSNLRFRFRSLWVDTNMRRCILLLLLLPAAPVVALGYSGMANSPNRIPHGNIPTEIPMPMMHFPPLMTMHFPGVQVLEVVPADNFVDGSDLYRRHCSDCHGIQTTSQIRGFKFSQISSAVAKKKPGKEKMQLNKDEMMAIIDALRKSPAS